MPRELAAQIAVVTGASRGLGKGIALALGEAGATVYVSGRTVDDEGSGRGSITETAKETTRLGGQGIAVRCDHANDADVEALFTRLRGEQGRLDLLVNSVTALPQRSELPEGALSLWDLHPFWKVPIAFWDQIHTVGLRSHYVASVFAAPLLIAAGRGLIVNISSTGAVRYAENVAYGVGKAGVDKLAADMAEELRPYNVACVSLWPRLTKTEDVLTQPDVYPDLKRAASPRFTGRAVASLAADPTMMEKTGTVLNALDLARAYGFTDLDGTLPDWDY